MSEYLTNFIANETQVLSAGTSSSSVTFIKPSSMYDDEDCMVTNEGSATAYVEFGNGSATAVVPGSGVVGSTPILSGETMILRKNFRAKPADTCAAITASGTAKLYFTAGKGN